MNIRNDCFVLLLSYSKNTMRHFDWRYSDSCQYSPHCLYGSSFQSFRTQSVYISCGHSNDATSVCFSFVIFIWKNNSRVNCSHHCFICVVAVVVGAAEKANKCAGECIWVWMWRVCEHISVHIDAGTRICVRMLRNQWKKREISATLVLLRKSLLVHFGTKETIFAQLIAWCARRILLHLTFVVAPSLGIASQRWKSKKHTRAPLAQALGLHAHNQDDTRSPSFCSTCYPVRDYTRVFPMWPLKFSLFRPTDVFILTLSPLVCDLRITWSGERCVCPSMQITYTQLQHT